MKSLEEVQKGEGEILWYVEMGLRALFFLVLPVLYTFIYLVSPSSTPI